MLSVPFKPYQDYKLKRNKRERERCDRSNACEILTYVIELGKKNVGISEHTLTLIRSNTQGKTWTYYMLSSHHALVLIRADYMWQRKGHRETNDNS